MNKTKLRTLICSEFYKYIETNFKEYTLDFSDIDVYIYPTFTVKLADDSIQFRRSCFQLYEMNCALPKVQEDVITMQSYLNQLIKMLETKHNLSLGLQN